MVSIISDYLHHRNHRNYRYRSLKAHGRYLPFNAKYRCVQYIYK